MDTSNSTLSGLEPLLSIEELTEYLDVPVTTIRVWLTEGKGPCVIKVPGPDRFARGTRASQSAVDRVAAVVEVPIEVSAELGPALQQPTPRTLLIVLAEPTGR